MKSRWQVDELKRQWDADGCWDLYDTEGFEEYRDELKAYQSSREAELKSQQDAREAVYAAVPGMTDNLLIALATQRLQRQIDELQREVAVLQHWVKVPRKPV